MLLFRKITAFFHWLAAFIRKSPLLLPVARACKKMMGPVEDRVKRMLSSPSTTAISVHQHDVDLIFGLLEGKSDAINQAKRWLGDFPGKPVDISGHYTCIYGADRTFAKTITTLIAHQDAEGKIDPYVIHLCRHFKSLGHRVVLSSAGKVSWDEKNPDWVDAVLYRTCPGCDFTSWKAALACFPSLFECQTLIFCNDSFFGPVGSFGPVHETMANEACDFWGITLSDHVMPHLHGFYLVFRNQVIRHPAFRHFVDGISLSPGRDPALYTEQRMSLYFAVQGFRPGVAVPLKRPIVHDPGLFYWQELLHMGAPLLKKEVLTTDFQGLSPPDFSPIGWMDALSAREYPVEQVCRYFWRTETDITSSVCDGTRSGKWPPDVFVWRKKVRLDAGVSPDAPALSPPGVFLHVYYPDRLVKLGGYIKNIPRTAHVYISTDTPEKASRIRDIMAPYAFAHTDIRILPNKGWDIGPFLIGFRDVIDRHPVLLKLHAKESPYMSRYSADLWRELLFSSLVGSRERVHQILSFFHNNPDFGMIASPPLPEHMFLGINQAGNHVFMAKCLEKHGISLAPDTAVDFPTASMFWCRPAALKPWLDLDLCFDDFGEINPDQRDGSPAHAVERLFFFGCGLQGLHWGRLFPVNPGVS